MTEKQIYELFARLRAADPDPRSELDYTDPYTLLVAVVLSAQATDKSVNKATPALFAAADTPEAMVALGEERAGELIKTIGLYKMKARHIVGLSKALLEDYGGEVPQTRDELVKLPGVGRKTANVVLNVAFGQPTLAVDTHIHRVANRTGMVRTETPEKTELALLKIIPETFLPHAHHWLLLHGRHICKAPKPDCPACIVRDLCEYPDKTL